MALNARDRILSGRLRRGRCRLSDEEWTANLSFVLHERSDSPAVRAALRAARAHAERRPIATTIIHDGEPPAGVDVWLAPSTGVSTNLAKALTDHGATGPVFFIDDGQPTHSVPFFRATAELRLPADPGMAGVAALVQRPGGRSLQLITRGPFRWPQERAETLRALEVIIQAHVEQWTPARQLWTGPIEDLLPDEVR